MIKVRRTFFVDHLNQVDKVGISTKSTILKPLSLNG